MLKQLKDTLFQRETAILLYVVVVFAVFRHHSHWSLLPASYGALGTRMGEGAFYLGASVAFALLVLRENPLAFGLGFGDSGTWAKYVLAFMLLMAAAVLVAPKLDPGFQSYYPMYKPAASSHRLFLVSVASTLVYMFGWEYLFRGFLLFSLAKRFGPFAVVLQMVPFVFVHFGKPELEVYSSIVGGIILGALALRTRSMWPCFLLHAFIAVWMDVCVVYIWA